MDKILANRSQREMSWSKRGANSLAQVIASKENGKLDDCIARKSRKDGVSLLHHQEGKREAEEEGRDSTAKN